MEVIINQMTAILKVLPLGKDIRRNKDINLIIAAHQIRSVIRPGGESLDDSGPLLGRGPAVHSANTGIAYFLAKFRARITSQGSVQEPCRILEIGED